MSIRKNMSLKNRFTVFKRDGFRCRYCGRGLPDVTLEVDHILPVSKGGDNLSSNLITSCFECNRGKAANLLSDIPESVGSSIIEDLELKAEKIKQINRLNKLMKKIREDEQNKLEEIGIYWWDFWVEESRKGITIFAGKPEISIKVFLRHLLVDEIIDSINIAISKGFNDQYTSFKYFCGICWSKIKSKNKNPFN